MRNDKDVKIRLQGNKTFATCLGSDEFKRKLKREIRWSLVLKKTTKFLNGLVSNKATK